MKGDPHYPRSKIPSSKAIEKRESREKERETLNDINLKTATLEQLRAKAKEMRRIVSQKQQEVFNSQKSYRIEAFKNQNYKTEVVEFEKKSESVRMALADRLINQYKNNQQSPLFYNEHGLSPFQLLLLHYSRNETSSQNICMICFMDIEINSNIVELPCKHIMHRQCAVQHLLYSKICPGCSQQIQFTPLQNKLTKM